MRIKRVLLFFIFFWTFSGYSQSNASMPMIRLTPSDTLQFKIKGFPVAPFGETLFYIYADLGPYTSKARANALTEKIKQIAEIPDIEPDSFHIVEYEGTYNVVYRDMLVTTILSGDSVGEKKSKIDIATHRLTKIVEAIDDYKELTSKENIIKSSIFSAIVFVFLIFFFFVVNRLFRFINIKIDAWQGSKRRFFFILNYEFFDLKRQIIALKFLNKLFRVALFIFFFFTGMLLMFYILPWTKTFTMHVLEFILNPLKSFLLAIWKFLPNLFTIVIIITIAVYINRLFRFLRTEVERNALKIPGFFPEWALPTFNIIRVIVWIFTLIVLWPYIPGSDSKIFQGISVFLGLVFSLTSASLVSNVMAGFTLTYTRAFRIGDRIKIGEMMGDVVEKSMLVTKIKTIKNEEITIPNSKIMSSEVINYSVAAPELGLILNTTITIGYDAPWKRVHELLISAALSTDGVLQVPKPFVFQTSLDDYYISYQINAYTKRPNDMAKIYSDLHQNIQDKFNEGGVEIMSPAYRSIRDGNATTIPPDYRGQNYESPGFKVKEG